MNEKLLAQKENLLVLDDWMALFKSLIYHKKVVGIAKIDNRLLAAEAWNVNFSVINKWHGTNRSLNVGRACLFVLCFFFFFDCQSIYPAAIFSPYKYSQ